MTNQALLQEALTAHRRGELTRAEGLYGELLRRVPSDVNALHLLGLIRAQQRQFVEADRLMSEAERIAASPEILSNHGSVLSELGRYEEAIERLRRAIAAKPNYVEAHYNHGNALAKLGRQREAEEAYAAALRIRPNYPEALQNRAECLRDLGRVAEAIADLRRAIELSPRNARLHNNLGIVLREAGDLAEARLAFERAIALEPGFVAAYYHLVRASGAESGQLAAALENMLAGPERRSEGDQAKLLFSLAKAYDDLGRAEDAASAVLKEKPVSRSASEQARASNRGKPQRRWRTDSAIQRYATYLRESGRMEAAESVLRQAIALNPDYPEARIDLGRVLQEGGKVVEAGAVYDVLLNHHPSATLAYYHKTKLTTIRAGDPIIAGMETLRAQSSGLATEERAELGFALAKAYEDTGRYDDAFALLLEANALMRSTIRFDPAGELRQLDRIRRAFPAELFERNTGTGSASKLPVFVIGFPRSGTTLTEQILASHPDVHGAGEFLFLEETARSDLLARKTEAGWIGFPESLAGIPAEQLRLAGEAYVSRIRPLAPGVSRIVDKMPANFAFAGLIRLTLPKAKIIHVMRDPLDTCLSCFSQLFGGKNLGYSYDLGDLGRYYRQYLDLMAHWRRVLPPGAMLEVQYEDVVTDLETQARRIIDFCELPWDDACLAFYKTERTVQTASVAQVRQPIYRSSMERWRHYEKHLGPLIEAIGEPVS